MENQNPKPLVTFSKTEITAILDSDKPHKLDYLLKQASYAMISLALEKNRGNQTLTAIELGINRGTLRTRLSEMELVGSKESEAA